MPGGPCYRPFHCHPPEVLEGHWAAFGPCDFLRSNPLCCPAVGSRACPQIHSFSLGCVPVGLLVIPDHRLDPQMDPFRLLSHSLRFCPGSHRSADPRAPLSRRSLLASPIRAHQQASCRRCEQGSFPLPHPFGTNQSRSSFAHTNWRTSYEAWRFACPRC